MINIQQTLLRKDIGTYYENGKAYTEIRCDNFLGDDIR